MQKSENIGLNIFEQTDKLRMGAFNENWGLLDLLLKEHGEGIGRRAKFACGSYVGQTANQVDSYTDIVGKKLATGFGRPVSSAADKIAAQLDFEPKIFLLAGSRTAAYAWTASVEGGIPSLTGQERQSFCLLAAAGMPLCPFFFTQRGPALATYGGGTGDGGTWYESGLVEQDKTPISVNGTMNYIGRWMTDLAQVATAEESGVYTVTVKGASKILGTENLADIAELTYHWVALG